MDEHRVTTLLTQLSEALDIAEDEITLIDQSRGILTNRDGSRELVVFAGEIWMTIPGYFGDEDGAAMATTRRTIAVHEPGTGGD